MEKEGVVCLVFIPSGGKFLTAARIAKTGGKENCPYRRDRPQNGNICADPGRIENDACRSYQKKR